MKNLDRIEAVGLDGHANEQEKNWSCSKCGDLFVYARIKVQQLRQRVAKIENRISNSTSIAISWTKSPSVAALPGVTICH
jgi:hypothetical protein